MRCSVTRKIRIASVRVKIGHKSKTDAKSHDKIGVVRSKSVNRYSKEALLIHGQHKHR